MTLDLADPTAVLLAAAESLGRAGLDVAAYGGLVLAGYGTPRETIDADLAVVGGSGAAAAAALKASAIDALVAFDRVSFGGNRITRLTLIPDPGGPALNTVDLVEPISARYARLCLSRAYASTLRGAALRVVTPEDFVILKILSTRDRDIEDAVSVMANLSDRIDRELISSEIALLAAEIPGHDVGERHRRVLLRRA